MKRYILQNKKAYDLSAKEYGERSKLYEKHDRIILSPFIRILKKKFREKIRCLDIGPGSGLDLLILDEAKIKTIAIDISGEMIKIAKKKSPKTKFYQKDILDAKFNKNSFEGIISKALIHLFPKKDAEKVMKKVHGFLVPGGILFICTSIKKYSKEGYFEKKDYQTKTKRFRKYWTEKEFIDFVRENGFDILHIRYTNERRFNKRWVGLTAEKIR